MYVTNSIYSDWLLLLLPNYSSHCVCIIIQKQGLVEAHRSEVGEAPRADSGGQKSTGEVDTSYHVEQFEAMWNNITAKFSHVFKQNARTLFVTHKPLHLKCVFLFQIFKVLYLKQNASWGQTTDRWLSACDYSMFQEIFNYRNWAWCPQSSRMPRGFCNLA